MTTYLQNCADIRMTITPKLFGVQTAKKYPFIEPGHAIPVEQDVLDKVFENNKGWANWLEKGLVKLVDQDVKETNLVETLDIEVPEDLNPESEGGKLDTAQGTEKSAPRSRKK